MLKRKDLTIKIRKQKHNHLPYPKPLLFLQGYLEIMVIHRGYQGLDFRSPVVTMGIFDGVHQGHRSLLDILVKRARQTGGESVIVTFDPHPRLVLKNDKKGFSFLTDPDEKIALLRKALVDHLVIIEFTSQFSKIKAYDFVREILVKKIGVRHLIVGYDHHFGNTGDGDYSTIKECAVSMGFEVEQVEGLRSGGVAISSSSIRKALTDGCVEDAAKLLGYDYSLKGSVVEGKKIGRKLGFPTANINPDYRYKLIPGDGVYAVEIQLDNEIFYGMLSIGRNPTVNISSCERSIEVNIFDFDKEIYGKGITIFFRYRLRDEIKFENTGQLSRQMNIDMENARRLLE